MAEQTKLKTVSGNEDTAGRELIITRRFDAPRELVFEAWTDPGHLIHWWGPSGFTNTFQEIDVSPGGVWNFIMHCPDGTDYRNRIIFKEIIPPELLSYTHSGDGPDPISFEVEVLFTAQGDKTVLRLHTIFPSVEVFETVMKQHHAEEGAMQHLDKLDSYISNRMLPKKTQ